MDLQGLRQRVKREVDEQQLGGRNFPASNTPGQQRRDHFDNAGRRTCTDAHCSGGVPAA